MKPEDVARWREWLGSEVTEAELKAYFEEHPEMAEESPKDWAERWSRARAGLPGPGPDFTAQVMDRIQREAGAPILPLRRKAWRRWAMASGLAAAAALSLVWYRADRLQPQFPGLEIRQASGPEGEPQYFVRFAVEEKGAKQIALAGDFNQWTPLALTPSSEREGLFTVELPLKAGTYSYAFVVDGKKWIADPRADQVVDDGFGEKNSVIRL